MKFSSGSNFRSINLQDKTDWIPSSFFSEPLAVDWIGQPDLSFIRDLAKSIKPSGFAAEAAPVIQPRSLDPYDGKISSVNTKAENIFYDWAEDGLKVGDLLVGPLGVILLTSKMINILFSSKFIALRFDSEERAIWLWAILNCSMGKAILKEVFSVDFPIVMARNRNHTHLALLDTRIPMPPPLGSDKYQELQSILDSLNHDFSISRDIRASWFSRISIQTGKDWLFLMRVQDSSHWSAHAQLLQSAEKVIAGKVLKSELSEKIENAIPVVGIRFMKQQTSSALDYTSKETHHDLGLPGDILLCSILNRLYVFPLTFNCVLGSGVFAVRPVNPDAGLRLQRGLHSRVVQEQIRYLQSRSISGLIGRLDVEKLHIPLEEEDFAPDLSSLPLSTRLDSILWR